MTYTTKEQHTKSRHLRDTRQFWVLSQHDLRKYLRGCLSDVRRPFSAQVYNHTACTVFLFGRVASHQHSP